MHVEGEFAEMMQAQGEGGIQQGAEQPQAMASQAPIEIQSYSITGVDVTDQTIGPLSSATVTKGRTFTSDETDAKVMLVEKGYAKQNDLAVGDTKKVDGTKYEIVGIVTSSTTSTNLYLPLARAQALADEETASARST